MATAYATKRRPVKDEKPVLTSDHLQEEIRKRAAEIYQSRNGLPGDELSDWLQAEKEITQKFNVFSVS